MPAVFIDYTVVFLINLTTPDEIKYTLPTIWVGSILTSTIVGLGLGSILKDGSKR
jgi:hypothetical protein